MNATAAGVCTCSKSLLEAVGVATSVEARAKHTDAMAHENYREFTGISCFAPVINIMAHPLWGRNQVHLYSFHILSTIGNLLYLFIP